MINAMQFRDYIFRHNPASITVSGDSAAAVHFCPGRGEVVQHMGRRCRRVTCRGVFLGTSFEDAMAQLRQFRQTAAGGGAGTLFIPGVEPFPAHLKEFVFEAEGDGRILPYTMVFLEAEVAE